MNETDPSAGRGGRFVTDRIPAEYWAHLAYDKAAGKARQCVCGEENPANYDTCHFCQRPIADEEAAT